MTTYDDNAHDNNPRDDAEFDLFLKREGKLAQLLQSLKQPVPSAMLDAAILAKAESALTRNGRLLLGASNDPVVPGASQVRPSFLGRWRMPMGLAASVFIGVLVAHLWQQQAGKEMPVQIAHAPQAQEQAPQAREPQPHEAQTLAPVIEQAPVAKSAPHAQAAADLPAAAERAPRAMEKQHRSAPAIAPPVVIAQANIPDEEERIMRSPAPAPTVPAAATASAPAPTSMPTPAVAAAPPAAATSPAAVATPPAAAAPPQRIDQAEAGAKHPPKPWLALIEELLKADLRRDALEEWKQFQQSYPRYPVPGKLKKELDRQASK